MTFNGINVGLSFVNLLSIPNWIITMSFLVGIVGFLILFVWLLFRNPVVVEKGRYRKRNLITKEAYMSVSWGKRTTKLDKSTILYAIANRKYVEAGEPFFLTYIVIEGMSEENIRYHLKK